MKPDAVYDITVTLGGDATTYPGDISYKRTMRETIADGGESNISILNLSAHSGTHIDAPRHFLEGAATIDNYPTERFVAPAHVIAVNDDTCIRPEHLEDVNIQQGDAVLFRTNNSDIGLPTRGVFSEDYVYVSPKTAELCVEMKAGIVGLDYLDVDDYHTDGYPSHHILLRNDVLVLEAIDLADVPAGKYILACQPLKLKGCEASPVRAILISN